MAYNTQEERLKVKGSEQITRDLKVNRDAYIGETLDTKNLVIEDDLNVKGESIFDDDVAIHGDLYVEGTTTTTSEAQVSSSGNYIVTRDNNATPLTTGEYSGLAVNNYATGKIATITADKDGTWRISDSATASATTYTNISAYNGVYYTGLTQTTTTGPSGILTNVDADELASVVLNGSSYYHKAGNDWFGPVTLVSNALDMGSIVTDATLIATLNGLTKHDLVYYRSATDKLIDASTNQPLLTREEASNLTGGQALTWDATNEKAVGKTIDTTVAASSNNLITSGAVNTAITNAIGALDVPLVGGAGAYISAISETDGEISATATTMDAAPTANSTNAVTSGGVKTAIDNEATARDTAITNAINALDVTDTAVSGKYVSAVSETNGKITVTRENLPASGVTGVKGNSESTYRTGNVNLTAANIGALPDTTRYGAMLDINSAGDTITLYDQNGIFMGGTVTVTDVVHSDKADYTRETAYCTTAAGTAAKVANMLGYVLQSGATFPITFTNANTAASALTLKVNNTTAKSIYINGAASSATNYTLPAGTYLCFYNGTNYYIDTQYPVYSARTLQGMTPTEAISNNTIGMRNSEGNLFANNINKKENQIFTFSSAVTGGGAYYCYNDWNTIYFSISVNVYLSSSGYVAVGEPSTPPHWGINVEYVPLSISFKPSHGPHLDFTHLSAIWVAGSGVVINYNIGYAPSDSYTLIISGMLPMSYY